MTGSLIGPPRVWNEDGVFIYTPTPGTARIFFEICGAGGPGGSVPAPGAGKAAAASGGAAGAYAEGWCDVPAVFTGAVITIGEALPPVDASLPWPGRSPGSIFLNITVQGGEAGRHGVPSAVPYVTPSAGAGALQPPSVAQVASNGGGGLCGLVLSPDAAVSGAGGDCYWGGVARGIANNGPGIPAPGASYYGPGRGGSGAVATQNQSARLGGAGGDGWLRIWEFS